MKIAYGYQVTSANDEYVRLGNLAMKVFMDSGVPGGTLVDILPIGALWVAGESHGEMASACTHTSNTIMADSKTSALESYMVRPLCSQMETGDGRAT